jgi:ABC-type transport system involved in multi-copper enzyme maturation permease subunit
VIAQTRSELLKIRSTRTTLGLVLGMLALLLLFVMLGGFLSDNLDTDLEQQRNVLGSGAVASIFLALAGILVVTSEYRFGTIRPTFLYTPRRSRVVGAKLVATLLTGVAIGAVAEGLAFAIGYAIMNGRGMSVSLDSGDIAWLVAGTIVSTALWGGIGVGLGAVLRHQVGSIISLLAWLFVVENLLFAFVPSVGRFSPGEAQNAFLGMTTKHLLSPSAGAAVLVAWMAVFVAAGVALTARRDVN